MHRILHRTLAPVALLGVALTGCSSTPDYTSEYNDDLSACIRSIDEGELERAHTTVIDLIVKISSNGPEGYEAQRALADAILVGLHASATADNAFLMEPAEFGLTDSNRSSQLYSAKKSADQTGSPTAHRLAAVFHAWHLLDRAKDLGDETSNEGLAPDELDPFLTSERHAANYAWLVAAGSLAELGFWTQAASVLAQFEDPAQGHAFAPDGDPAEGVTSAVELVQRFDLPGAVERHVYAAAHILQRHRHEAGGAHADPSLAWRFGCLAAYGRLRPIEGTSFMEHGVDPMGGAWAEDFEDWALSLEERGVFVSSAGTRFDRGVNACASSGEPAVEFTWMPID